MQNNHTHYIIFIDDDSITNLINSTVATKVYPQARVVTIQNTHNLPDVLSSVPKEACCSIFMDLQLIGMSGFELLDDITPLLTRFRTRPRIYILSACPMPEQVSLARKSSIIEDIFIKPLTSKAIAELKLFEERCIKD